MSLTGEWLAGRTAGAPDELRRRVESWVEVAAPVGNPADSLATAGMAALQSAVGQPGDRSVALDLLAADALVTLALLHQAEHAAGQLEEMARRIRMTGAARA